MGFQKNCEASIGSISQSSNRSMSEPWTAIFRGSWSGRLAHEPRLLRWQGPWGLGRSEQQLVDGNRLYGDDTLSNGTNRCVIQRRINPFHHYSNSLFRWNANLLRSGCLLSLWFARPSA